MSSSRIRVGIWLIVGALTTAIPVACPAGCSVTTSGINFGDYDVFSILDDDITGTINVSCQSATSYSISLSTGSGTYAARVMTSAGNILNYNLYLDPTRLTVWGDGSAGTGTVSGSGTASSNPVFGRIPARQNVYVGTYTDVVTVTVTF
jgi:spore coat protein U domain-containing protein, fimbrial subunit CupE1/2/3/6